MNKRFKGVIDIYGIIEIMMQGTDLNIRRLFPIIFYLRPIDSTHLRQTKRSATRLPSGFEPLSLLRQSVKIVTQINC